MYSMPRGEARATAQYSKRVAHQAVGVSEGYEVAAAREGSGWLCRNKMWSKVNSAYTNREPPFFLYYKTGDITFIRDLMEDD